MLIECFCKVSAYTKLFFIFQLVNLHIVLCKNKMAAWIALVAYSESKCFKWWVRKIINDGAEASTQKSQARFQIIRVSSSAEPRMRLE